MASERLNIVFVVERGETHWIAYPLGIEGGVGGQGSTKEEAIENAIEALQFHVQTFGKEVLRNTLPDNPKLSIQVKGVLFEWPSASSLEKSPSVGS